MLRLLFACALFFAATVHSANITHNIMSKYLQSPAKKEMALIVQREVDNMCQRRFGGVQAFKNLQDLVMGTIVEMVMYLQEEFQKKVSSDDTDTVRTLCSSTQILKSNTKRFMDDAKHCASPHNTEEIEVLGDVINSSRAAVDYICYNDGQRVISFFKYGGGTCLNYSQEEDSFDDCMKMFGRSIPVINHDDISKGKDINVFKSVECRVMFALKWCLVNHVANCPNPTPSMLINELFNATIPPSCNKYKI